jgi:hypothetical protein
MEAITSSISSRSPGTGPDKEVHKRRPINQNNDQEKNDMVGSVERQEAPDVSREQRTSNELVKLIRKLRWMGLEEQAKDLQTQLAALKDANTDNALSEPQDTD